MRVSEHFDSEADNMHCPCCDCLIIDQTFIDRLETLRSDIDIPFICNRFYSCMTHNAAIGGSENSMHLFGKAMDI